MQLGPRGIWVSLESLDLKERTEAAQRIERLGYSALWHPMAMQRDLMVVASQLLAETCARKEAGVASVSDEVVTSPTRKPASSARSATVVRSLSSMSVAMRPICVTPPVASEVAVLAESATYSGCPCSDTVSTCTDARYGIVSRINLPLMPTR